MLQHDIRNDLEVVRANAALLEEHGVEDATEYLDRIDEATTDAIALADSARDLSETMLGTGPERRLVSLSESIEREISDVRATYEDVVVDVDGEIPDVAVDADDMLDSVFRNALRNAVQHNDKQRPEVVVSASRTDEYVVVRVADNGPGIPDDRKEDIFGRGDKGLESEGTGIGTYLIDTLVTRYGGDVWVEDGDPEGAVFVVELPVSGQ